MTRLYPHHKSCCSAGEHTVLHLSPLLRNVAAFLLPNESDTAVCVDASTAPAPAIFSGYNVLLFSTRISFSIERKSYSAQQTRDPRQPSSDGLVRSAIRPTCQWTASAFTTYLPEGAHQLTDEHRTAMAAQRLTKISTVN